MLEGDEDEYVQSGDAPRPDAGTFVGVLLGQLDPLRDVWFIEDRQVVRLDFDIV